MEVLISHLESCLKLCKEYADDHNIAVAFYHQAFGACLYEHREAVTEEDYNRQNEIDALWEQWDVRFKQVLYGEG